MMRIHIDVENFSVQMKSKNLRINWVKMANVVIEPPATHTHTLLQQRFMRCASIRRPKTQIFQPKSFQFNDFFLLIRTITIASLIVAESFNRLGTNDLESLIKLHHFVDAVGLLSVNVFELVVAMSCRNRTIVM